MEYSTKGVNVYRGSQAPCVDLAFNFASFLHPEEIDKLKMSHPEGSPPELCYYATTHLSFTP